MKDLVLFGRWWLRRRAKKANKAAGENREEGLEADDEQTAARLEKVSGGRRGGASEEGAILASCFLPVKPRRTQTLNSCARANSQLGGRRHFS